MPSQPAWLYQGDTLWWNEPTSTTGCKGSQKPLTLSFKTCVRLQKVAITGPWKRSWSETGLLLGWQMTTYQNSFRAEQTSRYQRPCSWVDKRKPRKKASPSSGRAGQAPPVMQTSSSRSLKHARLTIIATDRTLPATTITLQSTRNHGCDCSGCSRIYGFAKFGSFFLLLFLFPHAVCLRRLTSCQNTQKIFLQVLSLGTLCEFQFCSQPFFFNHESVQESWKLLKKVIVQRLKKWTANEKDELERPFSLWVRKVNAPGAAWWIICSRVVQYGSSRKKTLSVHSKDNKHLLQLRSQRYPNGPRSWRMYGTTFGNKPNCQLERCVVQFYCGKYTSILHGTKVDRACQGSSRWQTSSLRTLDVQKSCDIHSHSWCC